MNAENHMFVKIIDDLELFNSKQTEMNVMLTSILEKLEPTKSKYLNTKERLQQEAYNLVNLTSR